MGRVARVVVGLVLGTVVSALSAHAQGVITGTITNSAGGAGIANVAVRAFTATGTQVGTALTNLSGVYTISSGLTAGTAYYLGTNNLTGFVNQAYPSVACVSFCGPSFGGPIAGTSSVIATASPGTTADFVLTAGATLTGTVTASGSGTAIQNATVSLFGSTGLLQASFSTGSSPTGTYSSGLGIPAGNYYMKTQNSAGFIDQTYNSISCPLAACGNTSGTQIAVGSSGTVTVNFALLPGARLTGTVRDASTSATIAGAQVQVFNSSGAQLGTALANGSGVYTTGGLPSDTYYLKGAANGYLTTLYSGIACSNCTVTAGTQVPLTAPGAPTPPSTPTTVDMTLIAGVTITGTITNAANGQGIPSANVQVFTTAGASAGSATANGSGAYTIAGLAPGSYVLKASGPVSGNIFISKLYVTPTPADCFSCDVTQGTPIVVNTGTATINVALSAGNVISGTVTAASGGAPLTGLGVTILNQAGQFVAGGNTDGSGHYSMGGLFTGSYYVRTNLQPSPNFVPELYAGPGVHLVCVSCPVTGGTAVQFATLGNTATADFSLTAGSSITGTVRALTGGAALTGVFVQIYDAGGTFVTSGATSPSGVYNAAGLPAGNYFARTANAGAFINMLHASPSDIVCTNCTVTNGAPITVAPGSPATVDFNLPTGGAISGTVHSGTLAGPVLAGVPVQVFTDTGTLVNSANTNGSGVYTVGGLPDGVYAVKTSNLSGLVDKLFDNVDCIGCNVNTGTKVSVTAGSTTSGKDFALTTGALISGTVTDSVSGQPVAGVTVNLYSATGLPITSASTDGNGHYVTTKGVTTGIYYARTTNSLGYVNVTYPNNTCLSCPVTVGAQINLTSGQTTSNVDFALALGGRISGTITDATSGSPLAATVTIYLADGTVAGSAATNTLGVYSSQGLPAGKYYARTSNGIGYVNRLYKGIDCVRCSVATGTAIDVTAGQTTSGIDFALSAGARISGTVKDNTNAPIAGVLVQVYDGGGVLITTGVTNTSGAYTVLSGLTAGTYYVRTSNQFGYINKLYDVFDCLGCTPTSGKPLAIAGASLTGIDFTLTPGGRISGTITGGGIGLSDATVQVFTSIGLPLSAARTASGGQYTTGDGLPAGDYYVVTQNTAGFIDELYDNNACGMACAPTSGTKVTVATGVTTAGINFDLAAGGRISGRITDATTGQGVANAQVLVYNSAGVAVATSLTDGLGNYTSFGGLSNGKYYVGTTIAGRTFQYVNQLYSNIPCAGCDPRTGATVDVTAPSTTSGIDFVLTGGEVLSGVITDAATGQPISGAGVRVVSTTNRIVGTGSTDDSGTWVLTDALPAGTYFARTVNGLGYIDKVFDNTNCLACDVTRGTPIVVDGVGQTPGINFALSAGGRIAGTVTASTTGSPIAGVPIRFFNTAGSFLGQTVTNGSGTYRSFGLPPGNYLVRTDNLSGFVDQLYQHAPCAPCNLSDGTPVTVASNATKNGIDFSLTSGGLISGYVKDQATGAPIQGVTLTVYLAGTTTKVATTDPTDANGYYAISLPVGDYDVAVNPKGGFRPVLTALRAGVVATGMSAVRIDSGTSITGLGFLLASCPAVAVTPATLSIATLGQSYSNTLLASGGTAPYAFTVSDGSTTPGLALGSAGVLSGAPTASGTANFTAAAVDANGCAGTASYALFTCAVSLTSASTGVTSAAGSGSTSFLTTSSDCPWTVAANVPWITITSAASGTGAGSVSFSYQGNPSLTAPRTGTITIGGQTYTVVQAGGSSARPFGAVDAPLQNSTNLAGAIAVGGWALDDVGVARVTISRDPVGAEPAGVPVYIGDGVFITGARPDVAASFPAYPNASRAGWGYLLLTNLLPSQGNGPGNGTYVLHVDAIDAEGNIVRLGDRTITVSNATATKPFGTIDTPSQGQTVSGTIINFGWMLTPLPKTIAKDGSTIHAYVDGIDMGTVNYDHYRSDIATTFPGLNNTGDAASGEGGVGFLILDTTQFVDGVHTIAWVGSDDQGAGDGVGSRYFTILNGNALRAAPLHAAMHSAAAAKAAAPLDGTVRVTIGAHDPAVYRPDGAGVINVTLGSLERMQVEFGACVASVSTGSLPVGAAVRDGRFYWQPGPAFHGEYTFTFAVAGCSGGTSTYTLNVRVE